MNTLPTTAPDPNAAADAAPLSGGSPDYWYCLIDENRAAEFLRLTPRTLQALRQKGGGPKFCRLSARCIRYRRHDLNAWNVSRLRSSTSDPGPDADAT